MARDNTVSNGVNGHHTREEHINGQGSPASKTNESFLAKASGACCLKGTLHEGTPRGSWLTIAGVDTYIVEPAQEKKNGHVLMYFPDVRDDHNLSRRTRPADPNLRYAQVWGMFNNGMLVMDGYADAGYLVLGLDYFRGDPVWKHRKNRHDKSNPDFDYEAWKRKHMAFANEATPKWVDEVSRTYRNSEQTRFVCVG